MKPLSLSLKDKEREQTEGCMSRESVSQEGFRASFKTLYEDFQVYEHSNFPCKCLEANRICRRCLVSVQSPHSSLGDEGDRHAWLAGEGGPDKNSQTPLRELSASEGQGNERACPERHTRIGDPREVDAREGPGGGLATAWRPRSSSPERQGKNATSLAEPCGFGCWCRAFGEGEGPLRLPVLVHASELREERERQRLLEAGAFHVSKDFNLAKSAAGSSSVVAFRNEQEETCCEDGGDAPGWVGCPFSRLEVQNIEAFVRALAYCADAYDQAVVRKQGEGEERPTHTLQDQAGQIADEKNASEGEKDEGNRNRKVDTWAVEARRTAQAAEEFAALFASNPSADCSLCPSSVLRPSSSCSPDRSAALHGRMPPSPSASSLSDWSTESPELWVFGDLSRLLRFRQTQAKQRGRKAEPPPPSGSACAPQAVAAAESSFSAATSASSHSVPSLTELRKELRGAMHAFVRQHLPFLTSDSASLPRSGLDASSQPGSRPSSLSCRVGGGGGQEQATEKLLNPLDAQEDEEDPMGTESSGDNPGERRLAGEGRDDKTEEPRVSRREAKTRTCPTNILAQTVAVSWVTEKIFSSSSSVLASSLCSPRDGSAAEAKDASAGVAKEEPWEESQVPQMTEQRRKKARLLENEQRVGVEEGPKTHYHGEGQMCWQQQKTEGRENGEEILSEEPPTDRKESPAQERTLPGSAFPFVSLEACWAQQSRKLLQGLCFPSFLGSQTSPGGGVREGKVITQKEVAEVPEEDTKRNGLRKEETAAQPANGTEGCSLFKGQSETLPREPAANRFYGSDGVARENEAWARLCMEAARNPPVVGLRLTVKPSCLRFLFPSSSTSGRRGPSAASAPLKKEAEGREREPENERGVTGEFLRAEEDSAGTADTLYETARQVLTEKGLKAWCTEEEATGPQALQGDSRQRDKQDSVLFSCTRAQQQILELVFAPFLGGGKRRLHRSEAGVTASWKGKPCVREAEEIRWPADQGSFLHFVLLKINRDTSNALNSIGKSLRRHAQKSLAAAGTKDKRGITVQRCSVLKVRGHCPPPSYTSQAFQAGCIVCASSLVP